MLKKLFPRKDEKDTENDGSTQDKETEENENNDSNGEEKGNQTQEQANEGGRGEEEEEEQRANVDNGGDEEQTDSKSQEQLQKRHSHAGLNVPGYQMMGSTATNDRIQQLMEWRSGPKDTFCPFHNTN
ncbi:hypothetical protein RFI_00762 [Reticulomyxa filosa]|uniref:Uncharacterized protein n=1 Tax=Reticulomyxa filosa TaxID=46433 RepID=X6PDM2_RETFI|nr:hypothetical protein RFI_00762 [Reticulomyxa filosa]|eukprot:ETO36301.1 hypothetical protein RFI_00762 [Reticulomyxa filosa]